MKNSKFHHDTYFINAKALSVPSSVWFPKISLKPHRVLSGEYVNMINGHEIECCKNMGLWVVFPVIRPWSYSQGGLTCGESR